VLRGLPILILALALGGCEEESDPVDIPFDAVDHDIADDEPKKPVPVPEPTTSASAKPAPGPSGPGNPGATRVQACCGALYARSKSAKDEGSRAVNKQAASVCSRLAAQVAQGKMKSDAALSRVRSSLLGTPPAACQ